MRLRPNGQQRLVLKGWTGCQSYESFQPNTQTTSEELIAQALQQLRNNP